MKKILIIILAVTIVGDIFIMVKHKGLIEGLDFGCGQYYYTDIPNWQHYFQGTHYESSVSMFVLVAIFFIWGWLMMKLWQKIG